MKRAIFSEGYHFFGERTNGLGLGQCGFDTFVLDQAANLIGEERFAMLSGTPELDRLLLVPHAPARMLVDFLQRVTLLMRHLRWRRRPRRRAYPPDRHRTSCPDPSQAAEVSL